MALDIYSTATLAGVIETVRPAVPSFWLGSFFRREIAFESEEIDFDQVTKYRKLAPYVMPTVAGRPQRTEGYTTKKFKPAYVKPLNIVNPRMTLERRPGEGFGGTLSPEQRYNAIVAQLVIDQRDMIERRWNKMAADAILDGSVTVSGPEYPTQVVDFGRKATHTVTLGAGSRWTDTGIKPLTDIEGWSTTVNQDSGYPVDTVIMGTAAWAAFQAATDTRALLDLRRGSDRLGGLDIVPGNGLPLQYKGTDGMRGFWVYNELYDIDESTTGTYMDNRDVLLVASGGVDGVRCFGAILDMDSLRAVPIFPKSYVENNPSARFVLSQSAPLMVPGRPDATLRARVVA